MSRRRTRDTWLWLVAACIALFPLSYLGLTAYSRGLAFPEQLTRTQTGSFEVTDRGGQLLAQVRNDGKLSIPVTRSEVPEYVVASLLAAEDKRFYSHTGIDLIAVTRALAQAVAHGRVVSGASTLTQQLARATFKRQRTLLGKLQEAALALRIEWVLNKDQILTAYLNQVEFGPNLVGIGAASRVYFAKPPSGLSLSEAATLAAIPRGPSLYNPKRAASPVKLRRDRILTRLLELQPTRSAEITTALALPVDLQAQLTWPGAFHWAKRLAKAPSNQGHRARTTLDAGLQRRVEELTRAHAARMTQFGASAAAVLVVDNASGDVLAYVGSPDYFREKDGQIDGVTILRQPGSALKPFLYAAAMEQLGLSAATLLPDIATEYRDHGQVYAPRNYDERFHGPVRLREALANSLNVPAVRVAAQLGPARLLEALHAFGFASLDAAPEHYGVALALGDGEVSLEELVAAYRSLAIQGRYQSLRFVFDAPQNAARRVVSAPIAAIITDILQDSQARASAFGRNNALEFSYPVAVKTGTSKGARDNWTVGYTGDITVGVWVGNFDAQPMIGASGVSGAGPLFHAVMNEAMAMYREAEATSALSARDAGAVRVQVCALSGLLPTEHCQARVGEWFVPGTEPTTYDEMHVAADVIGNALAPGCPGATHQVFERYPAQYEAWAQQAGRPLLPQLQLANCSVTGPVAIHAPSIVFPKESASYRHVADDSADREQLVFRTSAPGAGSINYVLDGKMLHSVAAPFEFAWSPKPGAHELVAVTDSGLRSTPVRFRVQ